MNFANLARQSHAMVWAWWSPCIIRPQRGTWSMWRRRCAVGPCEVRVANLARQSSSSLSCCKRLRLLGVVAEREKSSSVAGVLVM